MTAETSTLEQIKKQQNDRIGYRDDKPPMSYVNHKKTAHGILHRSVRAHRGRSKK